VSQAAVIRVTFALLRLTVIDKAIDRAQRASTRSAAGQLTPPIATLDNTSVLEGRARNAGQCALIGYARLSSTLTTDGARRDWNHYLADRIAGITGAST
jgi:hypothetical protein